MALDVGGRRAEAERAYEWLIAHAAAGRRVARLLPADGIEDAKLDTNVCAYVAAGVWHHFLLTGDRGFLEAMWPVVERAIDFVLTLQTAAGRDHLGPPRRRHAVVVRAAHRLVVDLPQPALRDRHRRALGEERPDWELPAANLAHVIAHEPDAFEPKHRWAMDWYYPVLTRRRHRHAGRRSPQRAHEHRSSWKASAFAAWPTALGDCRGDLRVRRWPTSSSATTGRPVDLLRRGHRRIASDDGCYWHGHRPSRRSQLPRRGTHLVHRGRGRARCRRV